jgi:hypothetical protein
MRVIKSGNLNYHCDFRGECSFCGCVVECAKLETLACHAFSYVSCPCCGTTIVLSEIEQSDSAIILGYPLDATAK